MEKPERASPSLGVHRYTKEGKENAKKEFSPFGAGKLRWATFPGIFTSCSRKFGRRKAWKTAGTDCRGKPATFDREDARNRSQRSPLDVATILNFPFLWSRDDFPSPDLLSKEYQLSLLRLFSSFTKKWQELSTHSQCAVYQKPSFINYT